MTSFTSDEIQRENLAQWRLGRVEYMRAGLRRALAEIGVPAADIAGLLQPIHRGICRAVNVARDRTASAIPPNTIVEWQPDTETPEMAILRAESQWRSARDPAARDRALCEAAHFGDEETG